MELEFNGKKWNPGVMRNMSFWHQCISQSNGYVRGMNYFGMKSRLVAVATIYDAKKTYVFMEKEHLGEYEAELQKKFKTKDSVAAFRKKVMSGYKKTLKSIKECNKKLTPKSLEKFFLNYGTQTGSLFITTVMGRKFHDLLIESLKHDGVVKDIDEMVGQITYPEGHTPLFSSQLDLYGIAVKIKRDQKKRVSLLNKWLNKYKNIPVNFSEDVWNYDDASNQLDKVIGGDVVSELHNLERGHRQRNKDRKLIEKKLSVTTRQLASVIREATLANEERKQVFCNLSVAYRDIFKKIALLLGSSDWRDVYYLTPEEIISVVSGKLVPLFRIKNERGEVTIINDENGKIRFLTKNESLVFKVSENRGGAQSEIKGVSACKGVITGTVKVVLSKSDFSKFKRGDILVASMTSVDYIPVMEMAGAFVTNEGGITSHASIVAREMNKPCIIGTKIATKVLKDGDLVEVDAEKGVVRIIKKA